MAQRQAYAAITTELQNVHQAWEWALATADLAAIEHLLAGLTLTYDIAGRFQEGSKRFSHALDTLEREPTLAARAGQLCGWLRIWLALFEERLGRYPSAVVSLERGLSVLRAAADQAGVAMALSMLGRVHERQGDYHTSARYNQEALTISQASGDERGIANALHGLGSAYEGLEQYAAAQAALERSLAIRRSLGMGRGTAFSLNTLGVITEMLKDYQAARELYEESLTLFETLGEPWATLLPLSNLGDVACTLGDTTAAHGYYTQALRTALELHVTPQICMLLVKIGDLLVRIGAYRQAIEPLALAVEHPATEQAFRTLATQLITNCGAQLAPDAFASGLRRGRTRNLTTAVTILTANTLAFLTETSTA
jgi:tetratricopeptide (TPR) repeat protein